jgi:6-phosphogluconolactonase
VKHASRLILAPALLLIAAASTLAQKPDAAAEDLSRAMLVYVGSYTGEKSKGISLFRLQQAGQGSQNATLVPLGLAAETRNPSYFVIDEKRLLLFSVNETNDFEGQPGGSVSAFSIERTTGKLSLINQRPSKGRGPCNLALHKDGRHLIVANYGGGSVAVIPVAADGRLGEPSDFVQHRGSSVHPDRQKAPHAHCAVVDPAGRFAFVCDLGLDKVLVYRFDAEKGELTPHQPAFASVKAGAGPRHMAFRPDGRFAYVANELNSTVSAFAYDAKAGQLREIQTLPTLPADFTGTSYPAEIAVHPSGKFVYVSNRGHNSIASFQVDEVEGTLRFIDAQPSGGDWPRHFGIAPDGAWLVIANQRSDTLIPSRIDAATGRFAASAGPLPAGSPVCVRFLPPAAR